MRLIFWWIPLFVMAIGAAYAFAWALIDLFDWMDYRKEIRRHGRCARQGCIRVAIIRLDNTGYCEKHASWIGWEPT